MSNETAVKLTDEEQFAALAQELEDAEKPPVEAAPAAVVPEVAEPAPAAPVAAAPTEPFPGFSALPEDVRTTIQAKLEAAEKVEQLQKDRNDLEARWKAQQGQLVPFQKKAHALEQEVAKLRQQTQRPTPPPVDQGKVEKWRQDYPEESETILGFINPLAEQMKALEEERASLAQGYAEVQDKLRRQEEITHLTEAVPHWRQELPILDKWIEAHQDQRQRDKLLAMRFSPTVDKVIDLWNDYARDKELALAWAEINAAKGVAPVTPAAPTPVRRTPDVDPNPKNRQSPSKSAANVSNPDEAAYVQYVEWEEAQKRKSR